jgi:hypothetical protein
MAYCFQPLVLRILDNFKNITTLQGVTVEANRTGDRLKLAARFAFFSW